MNKQFVIVIENKNEATKRGLLSRVKSFLKKHCTPKPRFFDPLNWLKEGDGIIVNVSSESIEYSVANNIIESLTYGYSSTVKSLPFAQSQILRLMTDYYKIIQLLSDAVERQSSDRTVLEVVVETTPRPKPRRKIAVEVLERVHIFERFVKIGLRTFKRLTDAWTGEEYIIMDDSVLYIHRDRYGREYLDVN